MERHKERHIHKHFALSLARNEELKKELQKSQALIKLLKKQCETPILVWGGRMASESVDKFGFCVKSSEWKSFEWKLRPLPLPQINA